MTCRAAAEATDLCFFVGGRTAMLGVMRIGAMGMANLAAEGGGDDDDVPELERIRT
jgi:hypothetical protein